MPAATLFRIAEFVRDFLRDFSAVFSNNQPLCTAPVLITALDYQVRPIRKPLELLGFFGCLTGDPSRIRTCNPRSRNPLLYPVELWDRSLSAPGLHSTANMKNPLSGQALSEPISACGRQTQAVDRCICPPSRHCRAAAGCPVTSRGSLRHMLHATFSLPASAATSPSPFRAFLNDARSLSASQGAPS